MQIGPPGMEAVPRRLLRIDSPQITFNFCKAVLRLMPSRVKTCRRKEYDMKTKFAASVMCVAFSLFLAAGAFAAEKAATPAMDEKTWGKVIHESKVENFSLVYRLLENKAGAASDSGKGMKMDHSAMEMKSHHLMVFPVAPDKTPVKGATAGFLVISPSGAKAQAMAQAMEVGYGANVDLTAKGVHTIRTKVVVAGKVLVDEFRHETGQPLK
jgi:hypothetical protein